MSAYYDIYLYEIKKECFTYKDNTNWDTLGNKNFCEIPFANKICE